MNNGAYVRSGPVNLCVNEAFRIQCSSACIHGITVQVELENIARRHKFRSKGPRHKKSAGRLRVSHADMAKSVKYPLACEDAICGNEIIEQRGGRRLRSLNKGTETQ